MMAESDPLETVHQKVGEIFRELVGDRAERIDGSILSSRAMDTIMMALADDYGIDRANEIALHMADWNWDAAFLTALHLFPERFTLKEVSAGIGLVLVHIPYHVQEANTLYLEPLPDKDRQDSDNSN